MESLGYPVQYIKGDVNFMGYDLKVAPGVFIPRFETEILVEAVLDTINKERSIGDAPSILDLCTGSGNIAIALSKSLKKALITASDISSEALLIAQDNASSNGCDNIIFKVSDLFDSIKGGPFDIIVSNPPYISKKDLSELQPEVLCEPHSALYGGQDGLLFYRRIIESASLHLKENGYLFLEIGYDQALPLKEIVRSNGFMLEKIIKDYNHIDRIVIARKSNG